MVDAPNPNAGDDDASNYLDLGDSPPESADTSQANHEQRQSSAKGDYSEYVHLVSFFLRLSFQV